MQLDRGISNMSSTTGMEDLGTDLHHWRRGTIIIFVSPEMGTRRPVDSQLKGTTFGVNMNHIGNMCSASSVSQQDASGNTYCYKRYGLLHYAYLIRRTGPVIFLSRY